MPFQPGHKINEGRKYDRGPVAESKKALRSLAMSIREGVHPDEIRDWLTAIWRTGKDPLTGDAVSLDFRHKALETLLERGWGQPAQHVVVDAEVRTELIDSAPQAARPVRSLAEINARREQLRALGVSARPIIDIEGNTVSTPALAAPMSDDE